MAQLTIAGIDIGSSTIKIAIAELIEGSDQKSAGLHLLGSLVHPTEGMQKGVVSNVDDVVATLSSALEKAERLIGVPLTRANITIGFPQLFMQSSRGLVAVSKVNGEIKSEDVDRVVEAAQTITTPPNYEMLHVLPRTFAVDGQAGVIDPVGMVGTRLEVDAEIIYAPTSHMRNLTKALYRTGCEIDDVVFSALAGAEAMLDKRARDVGSVLINIGFSTTSLIVFEDGNVLHAAVLPVGSNHVTGDIAIGLRTSLDVAERIKREHGTALVDRTSKRDEVSWEDVGDMQNTGTFSKRSVAEIIEARVEELFEMVDKELKKMDRSGMLPGGAILCGGGAFLDGIADVAKRVLKLPAALAMMPPSGIEGAEDVRGLEMAQVLGLLLWSSRAQGGSTGGWGKGLATMVGSFQKKPMELIGKLRDMLPW
ncbi:cell division protein FtsA [Candidatus Uhrbacteria bacterium]|nr:cell division protein FtsA [Candidatus Uhrbacteria bacterium]